MIGGFEFELSGRPRRDEKNLLLRLVRAEWPTGVVEAADGTSTVPLSQAIREVPIASEFFVYRDADSKKSWDEFGLTDTNQDKMVSVIVGEEFLLLICDDEHSFSGGLVKALVEAVRYMRNQSRLVPSPVHPVRQVVV